MEFDRMSEQTPRDEELEPVGPDCVVYSEEGEGPRTHVLIVGVGHYPYFIDGPRESPGAELSQLTSPSPSARALANWFIDEYRYPPAPLGSVALLVSEEIPTPFLTPSGARQLLDPDYNNFSVSVEHWFDRGNTDENNRLIFMFCGHGYGFAQESSLLMSDFDFSRQARWDSALDLGKFVLGMAKCAAAEQLYFIDACRRPHGDLVSPGAVAGRTPIHVIADPRANYQSKVNTPLFFATGNDEPALSRANDVSIFTAAFLKAMRGMAARDDSGEWSVNNYSLLEAMAHISDRLTNEFFSNPQQPQGGQARAFVLHCLPKDPISPVYLYRDGGTPCGPGDLHYSVGGKPLSRSCTHDEIEIELELPFGKYDFTLVHNGSRIASVKQEARPTWKRARLL
jgi:hypothetical protein